MFFDKTRKVVFIGAHTDDEMVCAGTLRKFVKAGASVKTLFMSYAPIPGMCERQSTEIVRPEFEASMEAIGLCQGNFKVAHFAPRTLPSFRDEVRQLVYDFTEQERPDIAFILSSQDDHQDHAALGSICQIVMKNRVAMIIRCHYPWNFINPGPTNLFIRLSSDELQAKLEVIRAYKSQHFRYDYEGLFTALSKVQGMTTKTVNAEAFEIAYLITGHEEER